MVNIMNVLRFVFSLLVINTANISYSCEYPPLVIIPDGLSATMEEMLIAQDQIKNYMENISVYLDCLNEEITTTGDQATIEYRSIMFSRYNAAVGEMEAVASIFNSQVELHNEINQNTDDPETSQDSQQPQLN